MENPFLENLRRVSEEVRSNDTKRFKHAEEVETLSNVIKRPKYFHFCLFVRCPECGGHLDIWKWILSPYGYYLLYFKCKDTLKCGYEYAEKYASW